MSKWRNIVRSVMSVVFLLMFSLYYANVTLFCHTHIVNGVTLVHSHFHSEEHHSTDDGGHTWFEVTLIANLTESFIITGAGVLALIAILRRAEAILRPIKTAFISQLYYQYFSLRAPPTKM